MLKTIFRPAHLKEADLLAVNARKLLHRKRDLLNDEQFASYSGQIDELEATARSGSEADQKGVEDAIRRLDRSFGKLHPHTDDAGWRENCEVLLVAFVLAIAIRAYFLQPFKIPTGSMEPTLNGIVAHPTPIKEAMPGSIHRLFSSLWLGRTYVEATSETEDVIVELAPEKRFFGLMDYTSIRCASGHAYSVHAPTDTLRREVSRDGFEVKEGRRLQAGESIVHGYVDTGDQVFVDKFTYNFRLPKSGDVFVFDTANIPGTRRSDMDPSIHSEYYIKRLAGTPNDVLRIAQPKLFINGKLAEHPGFARVMSARDGYRGYSNMPPYYGFKYLLTPEDEFTVPPNSYFALGDNSFNSSDSRAWGRVPGENVVGRGLFVYWPFSEHWGFIR